MRVIIDSEIFTSQSRGGISRHFSNLIKSIKLSGEIKVKLNSLLHCNYHLKENNIGIFISNKLRKFIRIYLFLKRIIPYNADLIHHSYYYQNIKKSRIKTVITAYDMIPESGLNKNISSTVISSKYQSFKISDAIVCISNFTKNELIKFYPEFKKKVHVIHLGIDNKWTKAEKKKSPISKGNGDVKYLTFIGNRDQYKNGKLMFSILKQVKNINLLFIGGEKPSAKEIAIIKKYKLNSRISFVKASDEKLINILEGSQAICIPSLMEGFSIPLIEGLYLDVPVIASNIPVHKEVGGSFANLLEPDNPNEWANLIRNSLYKKPSEIAGNKNYKKIKKYFSYDRVTEDHLKLYKKLVNK